MGKTKITKMLRAGTALVLAGALCGCSVKVNTNSEPKPDAVVAHSTSGSDDELQVTYEMFGKEYKYYLVNSGITDDTLENVAETCKTQREKIIQYLVNEQIIVQKAKELGVYDLTEEEQKAVDDEFDEKIKEQIAYFGNKAEQEAEQEANASQSESESGAESQTASEAESEADSASSDTSGETSAAESQSILSDEEKETRGNEMLDEMLSKCGMTRDDLYWWAKSSKITEKLKTKLGESVTREDAEKEFEGAVEQAEELYKSDPDKYLNNGYSDIWLPEGSRLVKHVLLGFDNDTKTELQTLRNDGKDDEADKLREEKAEGLKSKREEVEKKLDEGADIDDLVKEYSDDAQGSLMYPDGYTVIPNTNRYMEEFQAAAFVPEKIGGKTTCVTDYGVHIMVYTGDAKVSDESKKSFIDYVFEQLKLREYSLKMQEWGEDYAFEIDYETLRIDDSAAESSASEANSDDTAVPTDE